MEDQAALLLPGSFDPRMLMIDKILLGMQVSSSDVQPAAQPVKKNSDSDRAVPDPEIQDQAVNTEA